MGNTYADENHSLQIERDIELFRRSSTLNSTLQQKTSINEEPGMLNAHFEILTQFDNIELAGSWDNWASRTPMIRKQGRFQVIMKLPAGIYRYKFVSGDNWICSSNHKQEQDSQGNINNIIILEPQVLKPISMKRQKYDKLIPDSIDEDEESPKLNNIEKLLDKVRNFSPPKISDVTRNHRYFNKKELLNHKYIELKKAGRFDDLNKLELLEDFNVNVLIPLTTNPFAY